MARVLAGDVGGTKTLLALVEPAGAGVRLLAQRRFDSPAHSGLASIVSAFLRDTGAGVTAACFGVPGAVMDGECTTPNLPWLIRAAEIGQASGIARVRLINDFAAAALGVLLLDRESLATLQPGNPIEHGTRAVLGAGTGLGVALLVWDGMRYAVLPTEGGHADFAPQGELQRALQLSLEAGHGGRVSVERIVSGPGLARIYHFLVAQGTPTLPEVARAMEAEDPGAVVSRFGLSGSDPACAQALDLFVAAYGAEAGNLALRSLPHGGLYVAGGVAPRIRAKIEGGAFIAAFRHKGRMSSLMETFPVHLVLDLGVGLLGAAAEACRLQEM
jgi:glucokinase